MDLSTDEEEITTIMVLSKESEVEVQETLSVIEKVLTGKSRVALNIDDPILIERRFYQSDMSAATSSRRKTVKLPILPMTSQSIRAN